MPYDAAGTWSPGPNDHHVAQSGALESGLGADEPTEKQLSKAFRNGEARMAKIREDLERLGITMDQRQQTLDDREAQLAARERELAAREAALAGKQTKQPQPADDPESDEAANPDTE